MFLSRATLDPRSRSARQQLGQPYELHRTVLNAFPRAEEGGPGRVLYRADTNRRTGQVTLYVQSEHEPRWDRVAGLLPEIEYKPFVPNFVAGRVLRFRLRANPTVKREGTRCPIYDDEARLRWLENKGRNGGFQLLAATVIPEERVQFTHPSQHTVTLDPVRFDGVLCVTDPLAFREAVRRGVGPAKGFGFGLLSLAPLRG
jgi:CRISPR system Cascade subunit CasE